MSLEKFDEFEIIEKHYNFKNNVKKLDENEEDKIIYLLIVCKNKIEVEKENKENLNNYIKALKILIFYIPFNDSLKKKITEKKIYKFLLLGKSFNISNNLSEEPCNNLNKSSNVSSVNKLNEYLIYEVDKYELIFLINLITHNEKNEEIFEFLYPSYVYYIILNKSNMDNIFMLLNNFIINRKTYELLNKLNDLSLLIFLSVIDSLKKIKNQINICNYFYVFIENSLKYENKLFLNIFENLKKLYTDFFEYIKKLKENFLFSNMLKKWKIINKKENKYYLLKYIALMFRLVLETLYNILDEKNLDNEQISKYQNLYRTIIEEIKNNLIYINEINYFDNFDISHIDLYNKNILFMDMFIYYRKNFILENFKLILFISNIFSDRYEELDYLSCEEKKNFIDIIFVYLKTISKMRNSHILEKQEILYHKFILNRYIISAVANFSSDNIISNYVKKINGIDVLRKFMYIDDKDTCLPEYSILAIKHIKENENFEEL
ncbi:conserved Plasmodium protein, unknown function [Plasmodium gallinaceum]|uniref:Uncharacterized protein n=1 Tax=Plasmodium gallinaceum TaxID=5849 RepID=A0A1J1GQ62_PLAGA|nr:conserved Plasmodium protein, unknown function [Plasmodium gallinaceum]CRG94639.1 conserved Plasmodium protein, unknown function [Plasmodium gallinaceum]